MLTNVLRRAASDSSGGSTCTLFSRVQAQEVAAWERLVALYEPLVAFWCSEAQVPEAKVKETVELVFRAVAVGVTDFHPDRLNCSFRDWVRTITRNLLAEEVERDSNTAPSATVSNAGSQAGLSVAALGAESNGEDSVLFATALELIKSEFAQQTFELFSQTVLDAGVPQAVADQQKVGLESVRQAKSRVLFRLREEFGTLLD